MALQQRIPAEMNASCRRRARVRRFAPIVVIGLAMAAVLASGAQLHIPDGFRADAFSYLLFLRLVPAFPFFLVNLAPALVGVKLSTFVAATAIGILPATFAFAFFGSGLDSVLAAQGAAYRACLASGRS